MLQELHAPAPSAIFLATGVRPIAQSGLTVKVRDTHQIRQLTTSSLKVTLDRPSATLTLLNLQTKATWVLHLPADQASHAVLEALGPSLARITLANPAETSTAASPATLHVEGADPCFGLGERFFQAALTNTHFDVRPADESGEPGHNWSYVAVPLVYTTSGLGLFADTVFDTNFGFNAAGSAFDVHLANTPVTFYLFAAKDPRAILEQYTGLTGRPQTPPLWTFGPWINAVQGKDAVLETAQRLRKEGIPASALWVFDELDEPNNLGWPFWFSSYYGDPRAFNDTLHDQGFKVLGYVHPYVRERMLPYPAPDPAYQKGVAEHLLVTGADGLPHGPGFEPVRTGNLDFTNPRTVDWWQTMLIHAVRDQRWDGWMEDFGEYVDDGDHLAAGDGARLSEVYPLLYHKITTRIVQQINPDVVSFSRSGFSGTQQFPMLWGGDQSHDWARDTGLPSVVTAGITAGMSGYSTWGPDIICDGPDRELFLRWTEFGALTPVMRDHCWSRPIDSINLFHDNGTLALFRKYALLHSALVPYFATYAAEAHRTGMPILRHLALAYPADPHSATAEYEYLLGDSLLVAPVIEPGAVTRKLYLPPGEWLNYWTSERYSGGKDITLAAPLEQIPILVRAGAILPFKPEAETAALRWSDPDLLSGSLVWKVYPGQGSGSSTFTLPDGTSGTLETTSDGASVHGASPQSRSYEIVAILEAAPKTVLFNGQPATGDRDWHYEVASHELHASFTATNFSLRWVNANPDRVTGGGSRPPDQRR